MTPLFYMTVGLLLFLGLAQFILVAFAYVEGSRPVIRQAWRDVVAFWVMAFALSAAAFWLFTIRLA